MVERDHPAVGRDPRIEHRDVERDHSGGCVLDIDDDELTGECARDAPSFSVDRVRGHPARLLPHPLPACPLGGRELLLIGTVRSRVEQPRPLSRPRIETPQVRHRVVARVAP